MTQRSILLGSVVLLCGTACSKQDSSGDPWVGSASAGGSEDSGGDGGDDGAGGPCSLSAEDPPLTLAGSGDAAPGRVTGLALAGGTSVACGAGFVAVAGGGSVDLTGTCTGIVAVDDTTVAAVSDSGSVVLVGVGDTPSILASAEASAGAHDVAYDGTSLAVAVGSGGVASFDASGGTLTAAGSVTTALDVRAVEATASGWLVGGPDHITALGSDGAAAGSVEIRGSVTDISVRDGVGLVTRGPFGFDVVDVSSGVSSVINVPTEGSALDGALLDGIALVATGGAVHRYELAGGGAELSAKAARPDTAQLVGDWVTAVASNGDTAAAGVGSDVRGLDIGGSGSGAVAHLPRPTTSLFGEGDSEVVVLLKNGGNADMHVGELSIEGDLAVASVEGAEARDGCEDQWTVAPGGTLLVTLEGSVSGQSTVDLSVATNDASHEQLPMPIEINRPSLAVGQPAPSFRMMTFEGEVVDLAAMSGEVVFLKLFSYS